MLNTDKLQKDLIAANSIAALIPVNGIHITETFFPKGFQVAKHDAEGFTTAPRWFETLEKAEAHAKTL